MNTKAVYQFSRTKWLEIVLIHLIGLVYMVYLFMRADRLPITTDEGATFLNHVPRSVYDLFAYTDPVPNNHILNTLLIKIVTGVLPPDTLSVRLPALFGGLLYFVGAYGIGRILSQAWYIRVLTVIVFLANPFVLEFHALARGYGLSCGFVVMSVWYLLRYEINGQRSTLIWALLFCGLSVLASFTALNFLLPFFCLCAILIYGKHRKTDELRRQFGILCLIGLAIAAVCYTPLKRMSQTDQFEYWSKTSFLKETVEVGTRNFLMGAEYFGEETRVIAMNTFLALAMAWGLWSLIAWVRNRNGLTNASFVLWLLLAGTASVTLLQAWLINTPYLSGRTALVFWPLLAPGFVLLVIYLFTLHEKMSWIVAALFAAFFGWHICAKSNLRQSAEWYFDRDTYQVLDYIRDIKEKENRSGPIVVHCRWLYSNSLQFAGKTRYKGIIDDVPWINGFTAEEQAEFYYTDTDDQIAEIEKRYEKVLTLEPNSRFLYRLRK